MAASKDRIHRDDISPDLLRSLISYDPGSGRLMWAARARSFFKSDRSFKAWNTMCAGQEAFTCTKGDGYKHGAIFGWNFLAHRVAFALMMGRWPLFVDHVNGIRDDNRWVNLREATASDNNRNQSLHRRNKSGVTGVFYQADSGLWLVNIYDGERTKYIGRFQDKDQAVKARKDAERQLGYHPNHGKPRQDHRSVQLASSGA